MGIDRGGCYDNNSHALIIALIILIFILLTGCGSGVHFINCTESQCPIECQTYLQDHICLSGSYDFGGYCRCRGVDCVNPMPTNEKVPDNYLNLDYIKKSFDVSRNCIFDGTKGTFNCSYYKN